MKISQSLIKDLMKYQQGKLCGLQFVEKFLKDNFDKFRATDAMSIGVWFEYELTKALPKGGALPKPETKKNGELKSAFEKMIPHIDKFKTTMEYYGFEIISIGEKIEYKDLHGTLDLRVRATREIITPNGEVIKEGTICIVDIKTSGLLDDKWNDYGWNLDMLAGKINLILQPLMYKYIEFKKTGKNPPFLFFLYNTADGTDSRIINFICDDSSFYELEATLDKTRQALAYNMKVGFKAQGNPKECAKCPIKVGCKGFVSVPEIQDFYYNENNI